MEHIANLFNIKIFNTVTTFSQIHHSPAFHFHPEKEIERFLHKIENVFSWVLRIGELSAVLAYLL